MDGMWETEGTTQDKERQDRQTRTGDPAGPLEEIQNMAIAGFRTPFDTCAKGGSPTRPRGKTGTVAEPGLTHSGHCSRSPAAPRASVTTCHRRQLTLTRGQVASGHITCIAAAVVVLLAPLLVVVMVVVLPAAAAVP